MLSSLTDRMPYLAVLAVLVLRKPPQSNETFQCIDILAQSNIENYHGDTVQIHGTTAGSKPPAKNSGVKATS